MWQTGKKIMRVYNWGKHGFGRGVHTCWDLVFKTIFTPCFHVLIEEAPPRKEAIMKSMHYFMVLQLIGIKIEMLPHSWKFKTVIEKSLEQDHKRALWISYNLLETNQRPVAPLWRTDADNPWPEHCWFLFRWSSWPTTEAPAAKNVGCEETRSNRKMHGFWFWFDSFLSRKCGIIPTGIRTEILGGEANTEKNTVE